MWKQKEYRTKNYTIALNKYIKIKNIKTSQMKFFIFIQNELVKPCCRC